MRRVGALRARRIPLHEAFLFLNFSLSFEKEIKLGLLIQSFSSCYLCTSASGRAYFSFLHAPFVSKMAVVNPPPPSFTWIGAAISRCLQVSCLFIFFRCLQNPTSRIFLFQPLHSPLGINVSYTCLPAKGEAFAFFVPLIHINHVCLGVFGGRQFLCLPYP